MHGNTIITRSFIAINKIFIHSHKQAKTRYQINEYFVLALLLGKEVA